MAVPFIVAGLIHHRPLWQRSGDAHEALTLQPRWAGVGGKGGGVYSGRNEAAELIG